MKNWYKGGGLPKKVGLDSLQIADLRTGGGLGKKEGVLFLKGGGGEWYPNARYVI